METKIPPYDLRRVPAYGFAIENVRFVLQTIQELHAGGGRNIHISRAKDLEMLLDLAYREPQPILDYRLSGALKMVVLKGEGKSQRYEWGGEYLRDCQPSPYLKDNPIFK